MSPAVTTLVFDGFDDESSLEEQARRDLFAVDSELDELLFL